MIFLSEKIKQLFPKDRGNQKSGFTFSFLMVVMILNLLEFAASIVLRRIKVVNQLDEPMGCPQATLVAEICMRGY